MANSWIGLALLVVVPALLVLTLPRARLLQGMVFWVLSPAALLLALFLWELLTSKPQPNSLELAFTAFMYFGVFLTIPWLILCALGISLGWLLRRTFGATTTPVSVPSTIVSHAAPSTPLAPDPILPPAVRLSPCGSIRVETQAAEWANTHWVDSPRVIATRSRQVVLDLRGGDWDVKIEFPGDHRVLLLMRRYRQDGHMATTIDVDRDEYEIDLAPGPLRFGPLADLDRAIAEAWRAVTEELAAHVKSAQNPPTPAGFPAWRSALAILVGAILAIAALSYWSVQHAPEPTTKLTPLPSGKPVLR